MTVEVDVRDLVARPGASRPVHFEEAIPGMQTELASVPPDRAVQVDLLMESVVEGILASGPVEGVMRFSCARCLKSFDAGFRVDVQELFAGSPEAEPDEYRIEDGSVDLEPLIRDVVVSSMPFAPLCRADCRGLCARCGGDLNLGECACPPETDGRWAALAQIRFDLPDEGREG
ncbi:MAG: DUF177 domain-containing protein [Actinomycetota bacterium]